MNDVAHLIQEARGRLHRSLQVLRAPGVPREVSDTAGPVAHAIGQLDWLASRPRSDLPDTTCEVLSTLQRALHQLQWASHRHPSLDAAIDHLAGGLGLVFTLANSRPASAPVAAPAPSTGAPTTAAPPTKRQRGAPEPAARPAIDDAGQAPMTTGQRRVVETASTDAMGLTRVDTSLGANSPSNFYRGFAGDDIVAHGGLFVATYTIPELGQAIAVRVSLPDGRDFLARGTVKWRRLVPPGGSHAPESPPGFGLAFDDVPEAARKLIARFVQNREPLFHDDA